MTIGFLSHARLNDQLSELPLNDNVSFISSRLLVSTAHPPLEESDGITRDASHPCRWKDQEPQVAPDGDAKAPQLGAPAAENAARQGRHHANTSSLGPYLGPTTR